MGFEYSTKQPETKVKFQEKKEFKIESLIENINDLSKSQEHRNREKLIEPNSEHKSKDEKDQSQRLEFEIKEDYISKSPDPKDYRSIM